MLGWRVVWPQLQVWASTQVHPVGRPARCVNAPIGVLDKGHTISTGADTTDGTEVCIRQFGGLRPRTGRELPYGGPSSSGLSSLTGSPSWMSIGPLRGLPCIGMIPAVVTPPDANSSPCGFGLASKMAHNRLRPSNLINMDDHIMIEALKKLKTLILRDLSPSKLGRSLFLKLPMLTEENGWATMLADALMKNAVALFAEQTASLWRLDIWTESKGGLDWCMTTGEARWIRCEFLASSSFKEDELDLVGCHSLECLLPSWASTRGYLTVSVRPLWGHNLAGESRAVFAYSQDELTRIAGMVCQMVWDSRNKKFGPDASRAEHAALQAGLTVPFGEQGSPEPSDDDFAMPEHAKQLKVWRVTEQIGMTSSSMSAETSGCNSWGYPYHAVPRRPEVCEWTPLRQKCQHVQA